jgi:hypothetical protein
MFYFEFVSHVDYFHVIRVVYGFKIGNKASTLFEESINLSQNRVQQTTDDAIDFADRARFAFVRFNFNPYIRKTVDFNNDVINCSIQGRRHFAKI